MVMGQMNTGGNDRQVDVGKRLKFIVPVVAGITHTNLVECSGRDLTSWLGYDNAC